MDLQNMNGAIAKSDATKELNGQAHQNGVAQKLNGIPAKKEPVKVETPKPASEPKKGEETPQKADTNTEASKHTGQPIKTVLNLEATLQAVNLLHRRSIQRANLIKRIHELEAFEIDISENDEIEENPYQGCKLTIEDDKNGEFVTTSAGLIRIVAQFILNACNEKLTEVEAHIVFPNA